MSSEKAPLVADGKRRNVVFAAMEQFQKDHLKGDDTVSIIAFTNKENVKVVGQEDDIRTQELHEAEMLTLPGEASLDAALPVMWEQMQKFSNIKSKQKTLIFFFVSGEAKEREISHATKEALQCIMNDYKAAVRVLITGKATAYYQKLRTAFPKICFECSKQIDFSNVMRSAWQAYARDVEQAADKVTYTKFDKTGDVHIVFAVESGKPVAPPPQQGCPCMMV